MSEATVPDNPYVGPRPFKVGEALYGRDLETLELLNRLLADRIVLLYSVSGAGKTSLLRAGLIPSLAWRGFGHLPLMRVGAEPPPGLSCNRYLLSALLGLEQDRPDAEQLSPKELAKLTFTQYLQYRALGLPETLDGCVLFFDQFEEILTLDPTDVETKSAFFEEVGAALRVPRQPERPWWAVFAMREDYVPALEPYLRLLPTRLESQFRLELLRNAEALLAVQGPARKAGVEFQDEAAVELVNDLRRALVQRPDGHVESRPGPHVEPVHLQVVCQLLWERRASPGSIELKDIRELSRKDGTPDGPPELGSVERALESYYAAKVQKAAELARGGERAVREWVQTHLITEQDIRGQVSLGYQESRGLENTAIDFLVDAYVLRSEQRHGTIWYELAHDRLIGPVKRNNTDWLGRHLSNFQVQAQVWWKRSRAGELLAQGKVLAEGEEMKRARQYLTPEEEVYLTRSRAAARAREEEERRLRTTGFSYWDLAEAGWGVLFATNADPAVREALKQLLEHRQRQASQKQPGRYREFAGERGYQHGETKWQFLARNGAGTGLVNPDRMPYYLLLVGDPEAIPFDFQYQLDVQYAVGRLYFESTEEYARYARSVVAAESAPLTLPRRFVLAAPEHPGDQATALSANELVGPLGDYLRGQARWQVELVWKAEATRARLRAVLADAPALFLCAGHGRYLPRGDARQAEETGALLCQDWPGRLEWGRRSIPAEFCLTAADVLPSARLLGSVAFLMHGFSAGVPRASDFLGAGAPPSDLAPRAFIARLPQRLLAHPQGGMAAVVGHVDNLWVSSFMGREGKRDLTVYTNALSRMLAGYPVGAAMDFFNARYADLATVLAAEIEARSGVGLNDPAFEYHLTALKDARNYVVLGDPAVRLQFWDGPDAPGKRPTLEELEKSGGGAAGPVQEAL